MTSIKPLADRVIILPDPEADMIGGLHIPDIAKEKNQTGTVIALGSGRYERGTLIPMSTKIGDKVLYGKYIGTEFNMNNTLYLIIRESDIIATLEEAEEEKEPWQV
jgi:chaperonin GroES